MASARPAPADRAVAPRRKRGFAKAVAGFAKRVAALPGFPNLWVACAAAAGLMTVTGGFGTIAMPLGQRAAFWLVLMGWSLVKWQAWFAVTVRRPRDWLRAALGGAVLLSLPLPLEIRLSAGAVGLTPFFPDPLTTWGHALAIGGVVFGTALVLVWLARRGGTATVLPDDGLLARSRTAAESLAAIEAEDHYCRVRRSDGSDSLIHYRFGDALGEVAALEGLRVHRGAWVAASAVAGAAREGRRWHLRLADGTRIAVSATYLAEVRARGWLRS